MYYDKLCDLGIKLTRRGGSEKTKCPQCSDGRKNKADKPLSVNITTGEWNCHNCGWKGNVRAHERTREQKIYAKPPQDVIENILMKEDAVRWFENRSVSKATIDKFMIFTKMEYMPQTQKEESCVCFPYFRDGSIVNIKFRDGRKNFKLVKDAELIFFNLQSIGDKKFCIITEGEIDCMSVYEVGYGQVHEKIVIKKDDTTGEVLEEKENEMDKWAVVSVPNGASAGNNRLEYLDNCSDWFIGLEEIIIFTDGDQAGMALRDELSRRLGVERCKIVSYPIEEVVPLANGLKRRCKDPNEIKKYLGDAAVISCIENAEFIPVDGIYYLEDIFPSMLENFKNGIQLAPTTRFDAMDEYFRWKKGDITLCVGYGNHGKTFFMLQLMLTKSIYDGWKWAVFCPENYPANDFYDDIIEMYVGKWLDKMSEEEYTNACHFIDAHIFYVYPEDSHDIHSINEKFRYLILKKGVDGVMVDPFNQLDHLQTAYQREDQYLSENLKDIKRFALLNSAAYIIIAHPKNPTYNPDKSLPVVDVYDIAGGAMWANKCDQIISYHRPRFHEDKNSPEVQIYVQKVKRKRTGGMLGNFPLTLAWGKKRFADAISGEMPCDPDLASGKIKKAQSDYRQPDLWVAYKDENGDIPDADF